MNLFESSRDTANQEAFAGLMPGTREKPGFFSGVPTAAVEGVGSTINDFARPLADAATPYLMPGAKKVDELFKTDVQGYLLREQQKTHEATVNWTPDPSTVGWLGNVLYGGVNIIGDVTVGTALTGNPLAGVTAASGAQGYKGYRMGQYEGLDDTTAAKMGAISAGSTFLGAFLPVTATKGMALGLMGKGMQAEVAGANIAAKALYGAGAATATLATNTGAKLATGGLLQAATGIPTRGITADVLNNAGYTDMAKQYEAFDIGEIASDFAIGVLFTGGMHGYEKMFHGKPPEVKPSDLAAAMTLNNASHLETGTAPGIPTDPAARQAHVEAINKTIEDMLAGREVNVGDKVTQANFMENPVAVETRNGVVSAVEDHLGADWQSLKMELENRGLPSDTTLYNVASRVYTTPIRPKSEMSKLADQALKEGWSTEELAGRMQGLVERMNLRDANKADARSGDRVRGALWVEERLTRAERHGELDPEQVSLAKWLIKKNPNIANDLALSFPENMPGANGKYEPLERMAYLVKENNDPLTTAHEFLHHGERMMPDDVRQEIQKAWVSEVRRVTRMAELSGSEDLKRFMGDIMQANLGVRGADARLRDMIGQGLVSPETYHLVNPSEFWAVNASKIVRERAGEGWVQKAVQWIKELAQKVKEIFGLRNDAAVIRGLDALLKSDGRISGDVLAGNAPRLFNVEQPGKGVAQENLNGFEPDLRVTVPIGRMKLPEKPLVLTGTNKKNAARQIANIDDILAKFPDADTSPLEWSKMMAYAMATNDVPVPPYRFLKDINSDGAFKSLSRLSPGQISDATHGFENALAFRDAYVGKELDVQTTGKLFAWSFLSRGVSPYTQEGLFIDAFHGIDQWVKLASDGKWSDTAVNVYNLGNEAARKTLADSIFAADTEAYAAAKKKAEKSDKPFNMEEPTRIEWNVNPDDTVNMTYSEWARTVSPKGSGQPGSGATHNLNAFGKLFLNKMSARDENGVSLMQTMHNMMEDPNMTGKELRRWFITNTEGVGIDNKVVSFTLLVAGFKDVMVLDRVQIRQLWDDGRFGDRNLYDGRKVNNKAVAGSALSEITYGARGLLIYEAIERALAKRIDNIYASLGRPEDASIGRYHWETWVADSEQEASHGTLDAILHDAKGDSAMIAQVTAKEGEYGAYAYGARYGRNAEGKPYFKYTTPMGNEYAFDVPAFKEFLDAVKSPANKVVPTKFKVTEAGNAPWYERPEVNKQAIDDLAKRYAGEPGSSEGAGAVQTAGAGQAVSDQPGRGADPYSADVTIQNNPGLTYVMEDGTMISASRALAGADAEIATAKRDAQGYDAAVACALRG